MAGISNGAFRELCYENGASLVYSEMISDKAIFYQNKKTLAMLQSGEHHPVTLQLFGSDVDTMVYSARYMADHSEVDIIDINMGCPVNKVVKTGSGSALMKDEDRAVSIAKALVEQVDKPITVKMRLGYDFAHINCLSLGKKLQDVGVSAIALHGRTRSQFYEGKADWSYIKQMKELLSIPLIGNGDICSVDDFVQKKAYSGADGMMIGRAVVGNPFLINEISNYLSGKENYSVSVSERFAACLAHTDKLISLKGEDRAIKEMRGLAPQYVYGLPHCSSVKNRLSKMDSLQECLDIFKEYEDFLSNIENDR